MNEDAPRQEPPRQSKRKKATPQKLEVASSSPKSVHLTEENGSMDRGDAPPINSDNVENSEGIVRESPIQDSVDVIDSPATAGLGIDGLSDDGGGDTEEEMFFHVTGDGVITWQGSNVSLGTPVSDAALLAAYQNDDSRHQPSSILARAGALILPEESSQSIINMPNNTLESHISPDVSSLVDNMLPGTPKSDLPAKSPGSKSPGKKRKRYNNGPYECKVCHKLFAQSSSRNRHTKLHYGIYDYSCDACGRQFARREHLKSHVYKCPATTVKSAPINVPQIASGPRPGSSTSSSPYSSLQADLTDVIMIP